MIESEFARPIAVDRLGSDERTYDIEADAVERAALARRFDLLAIDGLTAHLRLRRLAGIELEQ